MASLRVGMVGSRFAARLHQLAYRRVYGVDARLAGVTSPTAERREAFARDSGAAPYATLAAMLPHVDIVDVCSPPATHEPVALAAIEAGKHVIIEKPFTGAFDKSAGADSLLKGALASAERIVRAARQRGVVLGYAENWVYAPAVQKER
jgi:predicted dehydrogenase